MSIDSVDKLLHVLGHLPGGIRLGKVHQAELRLAVLALSVLIGFAGRLKVGLPLRARRQLPVWIAVLADIHLGERADVANAHHGHGKVPEKVHDVHGAWS